MMSINIKGYSCNEGSHPAVESGGSGAGGAWSHSSRKMMPTPRRTSRGALPSVVCALSILLSLSAAQSAVIITSVEPNRGSLAGGTRLHIQVCVRMP